MQFVYHKESGAENLVIKDDGFAHLFKARRTKIGEKILFRNLIDDRLYTYEVLQINKKDAICKLITSTISKKASKEFNIAWCVVDPKTIEKTLPLLNEIGVDKIYFIYSDFSQKNFKIDFERLNKISIYSCEQCGRTKLMGFEIFKSIEEFMKTSIDFGVVNFSKNRLENTTSDIPKTWMVGCEGGFSKKELELLKEKITVGFETENILRSETAVISIASKILL